MKNRKIIIKFLIRFFVTYFLLLGIYSLYLKQSQQSGDVFACDSITTTVANQTQKLAALFGYNTHIEQHESELSVKFFVGNNYAARIVEGCNSISVIILFLTFIIAFTGSLKATIFFGLLGSVIIYAVNVFRILVLSMLMYKYPEYKFFLHSLLFPGIIYGTTFILWIIWVNRFSHFKKIKK